VTEIRQNLSSIQQDIGGTGVNRSAAFARVRSVKSAFTLVEVMVGIALMAVMGIALYAGIGVAFSQLRLSRENLRATQILEGKMEIVRNYNWDQVANYSGFIPTTFTEPFYANNPTNTSGNFAYSGKVTVAAAPITESYSNDLKMITIKLSWISRGVTHKRQAITFVSQFGLQRYVY
jgi:prepilin-type N-terminal cleavage/methylation domain-containing protein